MNFNTTFDSMMPSELIPIYFFMVLGFVGLLMFVWLTPRRRKHEPLPRRNVLFKKEKQLTDLEKAALIEKIQQSRTENLKKMPAIERNTLFIIIATAVLGVLSILWVLGWIARGFRKFG